MLASAMTMKTPAPGYKVAGSSTDVAAEKIAKKAPVVQVCIKK